MERVLGFTVIAIFSYMTIFFLIAHKLKNNSIVDFGWGGGFIIVAVMNLALSQEIYIRQLIVTLLVIIWGLRLIFHIYRRNHNKPEDFRYAEMRRRWGKSAAIKSFFYVFMVQGILLLLISYPLILINVFYKPELNILDLIGIMVWTLGFLFETISDNQLSYFIHHEKKNIDQIMTSGLWKYSRHPNYFGEATLWWGLFFITFSIPNGQYAIFSPILITFLLLKVSGVPLLEKRYAENKYYQDYSKRTNIFFPWFSKK